MARIAVVGSAWGDEGKGAVTDYLCARHPGAVNVRHCSSAQAGHTVVLPSGRRHVFHHFGAGTFAGAPTHLGSHFVINPIIFVTEREELVAGGTTPIVTAHPECQIATPYDMLLNQAVEAKRGTARHGSCGVGLNETMQRVAAGFSFQAHALHCSSVWLEALTRIRDEYVPRRARVLGLDIDRDMPLVKSSGVFDHFIDDLSCTAEQCAIQPCPISPVTIFEGAQGLRLDMGSVDYPHVTHAHTGLAGISEPAEDAYYVTRCYSTRHGAGPMRQELAGLPYPGIVDQTNIPNTWQGSLRFAYLDVDRLCADISADVRASGTRPNVRLVMTCIDQLGDDYAARVRLVDGRNLPPVDVLVEMQRRINEALGWPAVVELLASCGPTRDDIGTL